MRKKSRIASFIYILQKNYYNFSKKEKILAKVGKKVKKVDKVDFFPKKWKKSEKVEKGEKVDDLTPCI